MKYGQCDEDEILTHYSTKLFYSLKSNFDIYKQI